jgi:hypothetical protein
LLGGCFVFGPHDATPLPATDLIKRGLLAALLSVTHMSRLVFKMVRKHTAEQRIFIHDSYMKNDSARVRRSEFQQVSRGVDIPAWSTVHYLVNKFKTTVSIPDKKIRRRHVLTEEKLDIG